MTRKEKVTNYAIGLLVLAAVGLFVWCGWIGISMIQGPTLVIEHTKTTNPIKPNETCKGILVGVYTERGRSIQVDWDDKRPIWIEDFTQIVIDGKPATFAQLYEMFSIRKFKVKVILDNERYRTALQIDARDSGSRWLGK